MPITAIVSSCLTVISCAPTDTPETTSAVRHDLPVQQVTWNDLPGHVVSDPPLFLLPSRTWQKGPDDTWLLPQAASLLCHVLRQPETPLDIELELQDPTQTPPCLEARWDGEPVPVEGRWDGHRWRLEMPAEQLTPGTHFLALRRCSDDEARPQADQDAAVGSPSPALLFGAIRYGLGDQRDELFAMAVLRYQFLADLLTYGVTSAGGNEKLDGMILLGERRVQLELPTASGGLFSTTLHNASRNDKRLTVRVGETAQSFDIPSLERQRVHVPVPAGMEHVELTTEGGQSTDFFQVAAPHFAEAQSPGQESHSMSDAPGDATAQAADTDSPEPVSPGGPPIVLISLDTTRRDALGTYGGQTGITPQLDALASRSTVFDNARSTAPWTLPSHASMFTGLYPTQHGAGVSSDHLESDVHTLAERLRAKGYLTAGFAGGPLTGYLFGLAQGFHFYRNPRGDEIAAGEMTDLVEGFLDGYVQPVRDHLGEPPPVFLFINYFDPHFPYRAPAPHRQLADFDQALEQVDEPWRDLLDGSGRPLMQVIQGEIPFTDASRQALLAAYRAETSFMDQEVGRLLVALRRHHLLDEALILVTADHGELLGEGGYFTHNGRLDPELLEIPMILKAPGQTRGERVESLVSLVDIFPTVLRQAGLEAGVQDGLSLLAAHRDALLERPWTLSEEHDTAFHRLPSNMRLADHVHGLEGAGFRRLTWDDTAHCFSGQPGSWQVQDPCRELDAAALTLQQRVAAEARQAQEERVGLSAEEQQRLQALGYIQ